MSLSIDKICRQCFQTIKDEFYLKWVDGFCHFSCLRCSQCGSTLENEENCFIVDRTVVCRRDYFKRVSSGTCFGCRHRIELGDLVLRFDEFLFHVDCLNCSFCRNHLTEGDQFLVKDDLIYCHDHFNEFDVENERSTISIDSGYQTSPNNRSNDLASHGSPLIETDRIHRQKRLRTSFKHHQLRYLKCYFNCNHNPDSKELKILSEKIDLPKRVLQVWFQNARAKFRRCSMFPSKGRTSSPSMALNCLTDLPLNDVRPTLCSSPFLDLPIRLIE